MIDNSNNPGTQVIPSGRELDQPSQLAKLAAAIKQEVALAEHRLRSSVKHAIHAGKFLSQAKTFVGHGKWLTWFKANDFPFSESSAERYIRVYKRWDEVQDKLGERSNPARMTDLTFTEALGMLADTSRKKGNRTDAPKLPDSDRLLLSAPTDKAEPPLVRENGAAASVSAALDEAASRPTDTESLADAWLTPQHIVAAVTNVLGVIHLDPASDGSNIPAESHHTTEADGLNPQRLWQGTVFLNPPLSNAEAFVERLLREHREESVHEAIVLVPAMTDAAWFRSLRRCVRTFLSRPEVRPFDDIPHPLVAIYLGERANRFYQVFHELGDVYAPFRPASR
jgi:hypothetical protein